MENMTAEQIGRKAKALKHCVKLIKEIDLKGQAIVTLNCTGVSFTVTKGDAMYFKIAATKATLADEIASYEFVKKYETKDYTRIDVEASKKRDELSHKISKGVKEAWAKRKKAVTTT